jgi:hypothetical protein
MPAVTGKSGPCPLRLPPFAFALLVAALPALAEPTATVPVDPYDSPPPVARSVPLEALVQSISVWVATELDLPMPSSMPRIVFSSPRRMVELRYGMAAREDLRVIALYHARTQRLFLDDSWTGATPVELSILVHEIVHHVEAQAGVQFYCYGHRERSAYALQERWLAQFGVDMLDAFDMTRAGVERSSSCRR